MQSVGGAIIGGLLGLLLSAGVLSVLCIVWYFVALLSLANVPLTEEACEFGANHAAFIATSVLVACCGGLSLFGGLKGMAVYTSVDF